MGLAFPVVGFKVTPWFFCTHTCLAVPKSLAAVRNPAGSEERYLRVMALKLIKTLPLHALQRYPPVGSVCPTRPLGSRGAGHPLWASCLCTPASGFVQRHGSRKLLRDCGRRNLIIVAKEPSYAVGDYFDHERHRGPFTRVTKLRQPEAAEEEAFRQRLELCSRSRQVLALLRSVGVVSDTMAAAALHRVADLEQAGDSLRDPSVLEEDTMRTLCRALELNFRRLTDAGLASALLACTRLFLDPRSTLVARLVSVSRERLDGGQMSVGQLCMLGRATLALQGPDGAALEQVTEQIRRQEPDQWSLEDLIAVYKFLQGGVARDGKCQRLLNAMHAHAETLAPRMDPGAVSGLLGALATLDQKQAAPLVVGLCEQAARHVPRFTDEELTAVLAALAHLDHSDRHIEEAVEAHVTTRTFTLRPETVAEAVQFFARRNVLSPAVLDAVSESFVYRADAYSTGQVAAYVVALGKLGHLPPNAGEVFRKVEAVVYSRFSHFQPRTLLNLLHSCILIERFPVNFVAQVFSNHFLYQLQEPDAAMNPMVLAQLTQLDMTLELECPHAKLPPRGSRLHPKYRVKSFLASGGASLETPVDAELYDAVANGLVDLLGARSRFGSQVLTPHRYTLDVEIKLDTEGYVLPARNNDNVYKRIALCIDGEERFTTNKRQLLGKEATKQRHLRLLGYEVVQIPHYEFEELRDKASVVEYLHNKVFPDSYWLRW